MRGCSTLFCPGGRRGAKGLRRHRLPRHRPGKDQHNMYHFGIPGWESKEFRDSWNSLGFPPTPGGIPGNGPPLRRPPLRAGTHIYTLLQRSFDPVSHQWVISYTYNSCRLVWWCSYSQNYLIHISYQYGKYRTWKHISTFATRVKATIPKKQKIFEPYKPYPDPNRFLTLNQRMVGRHRWCAHQGLSNEPMHSNFWCVDKSEIEMQALLGFLNTVVRVKYVRPIQSGQSPVRYRGLLVISSSHIRNISLRRAIDSLKV